MFKYTALFLALFAPLTAYAADDEDLRDIREQIHQLKESYEQRIQQLEQRLQRWINRRRTGHCRRRQLPNVSTTRHDVAGSPPFGFGPV